MSFPQYKSQLLAALEDKPQNPFNTEGSWKWFVKGDVSGIQEFIFSIKSDKASKQLKARSKFIAEQTTEVYNQIKKDFKSELIYNGGGNLYLLVESMSEEQFNSLEANVNQSLFKRDLYVALSKTAIVSSDLKQFDLVWKAVQVQSVSDKFKKYKYATDDKSKEFDLIFNPYQHKEKDDEFTLTKAERKDKVATWNKDLLEKYKDLIHAVKEADKDKKDRGYIKPEDKAVIEFRYLSAFAKLRTGTEKLAVLKMDVDYLGDTFTQRKELSSVKDLSKSIEWFFDNNFEELLEKPFNTEGDTFRDNIYVVFAGGDDCFLVGAWDAVFQFAKVIRNSFKDFTNDKLKLSASLTLIDEKYPVIRFARSAEDALKNAKESNPDKNRISVFNQILTWHEYEAAQKIALKLEDLINNKDESRAIIERIKRSRLGYENAQNNINEGFLKAQEVWRLQWFLRSAKNKVEMQEILDEYHRLLLRTITEGVQINPMVFPVAARWAEFLTKK
jgi:CRISPR-associated protein Csm1